MVGVVGSSPIAPTKFGPSVPRGPEGLFVGGRTTCRCPRGPPGPPALLPSRRRTDGPNPAERTAPGAWSRPVRAAARFSRPSLSPAGKAFASTTACVPSVAICATSAAASDLAIAGKKIRLPARLRSAGCERQSASRAGKIQPPPGRARTVRQKRTPKKIVILSEGSLASMSRQKKVRERCAGGGGEIRTHGRLAPSSVFKTDPLSHSGTPPVAEMIAGIGETIPPKPA